MSHRYNHYSHWCGLSILITFKLWLWLFIILHVGLVGTISEWVRPLYAVAESGLCHQAPASLHQVTCCMKVDN